jgi:hypothetical protein
MTIENKSVAGEARLPRLYPSDIRPRLQTVLAACIRDISKPQSAVDEVPSSKRWHGCMSATMSSAHLS